MGVIEILGLVGIIAAPVIILGSIYAWYKKIPLEKIKITATTSGIFFTFFGILIALWGFDSNDISGSIPQLLDGLKVAFFTSVAGLLVSLVVTFCQRFELSDDNSNADNNKDTQKEILEELRNINKSIVGEGDSSLNSQIRNLRQDNTDNLKAIKNSFDQFAEKITNQNIDALTKAIEKVMGEFNTTINERLGEVFDNFRHSVDALNKWQQEYKTHITEQSQNIRQLLETQVSASSDLEQMRENYEKIAEINETFDILVQKLNNHIQGGLDLTSALNELSDELTDSSDEIKKELLSITKNSAIEMEKTMNKTLADFGSSLASISSRLATDFRVIQEILEKNRDS